MTLAASIESQSFEDRRRTPRIPLRAEVTLNSEDNFFTGFSSDLSEGGIFVITHALLERGARVHLSIALPNDVAVEAVGEVRWVRPFNPLKPNVLPGMGIQFVEMADANRQAVEQFMRYRQPLFFTT